MANRIVSEDRRWYHTADHPEPSLMLAFPVAFALSCLAGLLWLVMDSPKGSEIEDSGRDRLLRVRFDAGLWSLLGGLLGARIVFVLAHLGYYGSNPLEILQIWQGGLSWSGAAVGAPLALFVYTSVRKRPFWDLADALAAPSALLALGLWVGCQLDHCAYGVRVQSGSMAIVSPDIFGVVLPRWPTQLVGAVCSGLVLTGAVLLRDRLPRPGILASLTLALLAAIMLLLSLTRGDPVGAILGVRLDTIGAAAILVAALVALGLRVWRK
jgi:phosphatidylglycerol:prolipoprotein diacylglycerol transferase